ncbi:MAG: hypothetical protein AAF251_03175 [Pseudomonadota bacterium]
MARYALSEQEIAFLSRYAQRRFWGYRFEHPEGTPENVAMVERLEEYGIIKRQLTPEGFVNFKVTREGRRAMGAI